MLRDEFRHHRRYFGFVRVSGDYIGGGDVADGFLRICLRVAAAEHGYSVGVQRFAVGNGLTRLFYADAGDGAGIDYIHVGVGVFLRRGVPCGKECGVYRGALAGVHLTAQGDYTECHGYLFSHGLPIISTGVVRFRNFSQNQNFI